MKLFHIFQLYYIFLPKQVKDKMKILILNSPNLQIKVAIYTVQCKYRTDFKSSKAVCPDKC